MPTDTQTSGELALAFEPSGHEQIPGNTILTRLNYFDGKFLRADALRVEQDYLRRLAELGARAGGPGLVYGFDVSLDDGELLTIGGGLGFDAAGRVLYLPDAFGVGLQMLIDRTIAAHGQSFALTGGSSGFAVCEPDAQTPSPTTPAGAEFYLITIAHAEEACGEEDVFGKLCDDGCATSTDRAYLIEGVIARATPYIPKTPFATSKAVQLTAKHVRSQLVSAAFADERLIVPSLISKAGLASGAWCTGAPAPTGWEVPIAVVGRLAAGSFVDEWVVRRERMDGPPRSFWAWSMAMRPWQAFLAQVLQFQCQLPSALAGRGGDATDVDPCKPQTQLLGEMAAYVQDLELAFARDPAEVASNDVQLTTSIQPFGGLPRIQGLHAKLKAVLAAARAPSRRILIDGGILELPPAGYLPVTPGTSPPVEEQVRRLLGDGVDLRFCVVSPDYVPRALESAQHMERISLLQGLDDTTSRPKVDVLVPAGQLTGPPATKARGWDTSLVLTGSLVGGLAGDRAQAVGVAAEATNLAFLLHGVGRSAPLEPGGRFDFAGERETQEPQLATLGTHLDFSVPLSQPGATVDAAVEGPRLGTYLAVECPVDPWALAVGQDVTLSAGGAFGMTAVETPFGGAATATGQFTVEQREGLPGGGVRVRALGTLAAQGHTVGSNANSGSGSLGVRIDVRLDTGATPPTFEATVTSSEEGKSGEILLWARWQGHPLEVDGALGLEDPTDGTSVPAPAGVTITDGPSFTRPLAYAHLIADDGVFTPGDPLRSKATDALETLASVLDDPRYTGEIESRLFDPSAENGGPGALTATLDWVLFHRRRERACGPSTEAPAVTTAKELVLFVDRERAKQVSTLIQAGNVAAALQLADTVGDAEFTEATATLVTPAAALKQSWDAIAGGPPNAAGVVGVSPSDTTLLRSRALAVGAACGGQFTLVQFIGANALPSGYDAAIFLRGPAKLEAVVYHVYGAWEGDAITELGKTNDIDAFIQREEVRNAGTISFEGGTTTVGAMNLQPLSELFEPTPNVVAAWVFSRPNESTDEPAASQVDEIISQGGAAKGSEFQLATAASTTDAAWPTDTTLICVLSIRPTHQ